MDAMAKDRKITVDGKGDPYTKKMYDLMRMQETGYEDDQYYYKRKGNTLYKVPKGSGGSFRGLA
jgi:hypothetical protein